MDNFTPQMELNGETYYIDESNSRLVKKNDNKVIVHWFTLSDVDWATVERKIDEASDY